MVIVMVGPRTYSVPRDAVVCCRRDPRLESPPLGPATATPSAITPPPTIRHVSAAHHGNVRCDAWEESRRTHIPPYDPCPLPRAAPSLRTNPSHSTGSLSAPHPNRIRTRTPSPPLQLTHARTHKTNAYLGSAGRRQCPRNRARSPETAGCTRVRPAGPSSSPTPPTVPANHRARDPHHQPSIHRTCARPRSLAQGERTRNRTTSR